MSCRASFQRTGGWCEPGSGGRAAGAGAGGPKERSSRASRGCRRYHGTGLLEPERAYAQSVKPGGTAVNVCIYRPGSRISAPGTFFYSPLRLSGGHMRKGVVSP